MNEKAISGNFFDFQLITIDCDQQYFYKSKTDLCLRKNRITIEIFLDKSNYCNLNVARVSGVSNTTLAGVKPYSLH